MEVCGSTSHTQTRQHLQAEERQGHAGLAGWQQAEKMAWPGLRPQLGVYQPWALGRTPCPHLYPGADNRTHLGG